MATTAEKPTSALKKELKLNTYPFYSPRFWHGMCLGDWLTLVRKNRCRMHPLRWFLAFNTTLVAGFNSVLAALQRGMYGRKIDETVIDHPPIFIIGHWRSGTTHLHELMVRDERFAYPTYYECFEPNHCLVSSWWAPTLLWPLLPRKRPMDNMATGWDRPQEDEFALVAMGSPTPYMRMAFPNHSAPYDEFLDMQGCAPEDLARWRSDMQRFVKMLTFKNGGKRLVMKSPPHTGRIQELAELFPHAKFIHVIRDPNAVFPSTRRLWVSLDWAQGFQHPHHRDLDEYVLRCFERMYRGFERQQPTLGRRQFCEVRYENLVRDPVGELRRIYTELELGDFEPVRPAIEAYAATQKDYKTNRHELEPGLRDQIRKRWAWYFERYGYE